MKYDQDVLTIDGICTMAGNSRKQTCKMFRDASVRSCEYQRPAFSAPFTLQREAPFIEGGPDEYCRHTRAVSER